MDLSEERWLYLQALLETPALIYNKHSLAAAALEWIQIGLVPPIGLDELEELRMAIYNSDKLTERQQDVIGELTAELLDMCRIAKEKGRIMYLLEVAKGAHESELEASDALEAAIEERSKARQLVEEAFRKLDEAVANKRS